MAGVGPAVGSIVENPELLRGWRFTSNAMPLVVRRAVEINADAGFRRIGSIAICLSLPVGRELEPPRWRTLVELDRKARGGAGWVDKAWVLLGLIRRRSCEPS